MKVEYSGGEHPVIIIGRAILSLLIKTIEIHCNYISSLKGGHSCNITPWAKRAPRRYKIRAFTCRELFRSFKKSFEKQAPG
jgi:hypothetical protein